MKQKRMILAGIFLVLVLGFGVFSFWSMYGEKQAQKAQEQVYVDPYGKEWKYKKTLSEVVLDGAQEITYVIYTNEESLTWELVRGAMYGNIKMGAESTPDSRPGQYPQFYLVSEECVQLKE